MSLELLLSALACLLAGTAAWAALRARRDPEGERRALEDSASRTRQELQAATSSLLRPLAEDLAQLRASQAEHQEVQLRRQAEGIAQRFELLTQRIQEALSLGRQEQAQRLLEVQEQVRKDLEAIRSVNEAKLEQMRQTVDEKLHATLEQRLGESFRQVSERLEAVQSGLGEMRNLAQDVGGLKRALSNVKTRGVLGEAQLGALLEQYLSPGQYQANVKVRPRSAELVEFAVKLPGPEEGSTVWLPIDAKFPLEDYQRLTESYESGDLAGVDVAARALEQRLLSQARDIRDKYVAPPHTTDFALLFLPFEGLYAEALRRPGLLERIQRECRVTFVGPTTLTAFLNSLQVGFKTLAISKRSSEVWKILGAVKAEFGTFGKALEQVEARLEDASKKLGEVGRRSEQMQKKLGKVESLPEDEARMVLSDSGASLEA